MADGWIEACFRLRNDKTPGHCCEGVCGRNGSGVFSVDFFDVSSAKLKRAASADLWLVAPPHSCYVVAIMELMASARLSRARLEPLNYLRISLRIHSHISGPGLILALQC